MALFNDILPHHRDKAYGEAWGRVLELKFRDESGELSTLNTMCQKMESPNNFNSQLKEMAVCAALLSNSEIPTDILGPGPEGKYTILLSLFPSFAH